MLQKNLITHNIFYLIHSYCLSACIESNANTNSESFNQSYFEPNVINI